MRIEDFELKCQPFRRQGRPVVFVHNQSQQAADEFLLRVLKDSGGVGELYGIESSGKTTIIDQFVRALPAEIAVAVVDGTGIGANQLLATVLAQFGYKGSIDLASDLLSPLKEVIVESMHTDQAPLLVLKNIDKMYSSGQQVLCELAALTINQQFALRFILVNKQAYCAGINSPNMRSIAARLVDTFELQPLTAKETVAYLHAKLRAAGAIHPHQILPTATCVELHKESGGWPGKLDGLALCVIERAEELPMRHENVHSLATQCASFSCEAVSTAKSIDGPDVPKLLVTSNGKLLQKFEVRQTNVLIGRACLNDVVMKNEYVSKYHALLIFNDNMMYLLDLKSANGIYVNSHRVRSTVLRHDDVLEIGNHRIKIDHPASRGRAANPDSDPADTSIMKTLADMRRVVAKKIRSVSSKKRKRTNTDAEYNITRHPGPN